MKRTWPLEVCRIRYGLYCLALILTIGCGRGSSEPPGIFLEHIRTIALEESDSLFVGSFSTVTVAYSPFRLYVPDVLAHQVAVYDSLGRIVRFFGSQGEGPGELDRPKKIVLYNGLLYVDESRRFSVFDTAGVYRWSATLPDGVYSDDTWGLNSYGDMLLLPAADMSQKMDRSLRASPNENTVALLDSSFRLLEMMGHYPAFYQDGEYVASQRALDVTPSGRVAVGYSLLPDVDLYDLEDPARELLRTVSFVHPDFRLVPEEWPALMPYEEVMKLHMRMSRTRGVFLIRNDFILWFFRNYHDDFYDTNMSETAADHLGAVARFGGEQLGTLTLPGPILGCDEEGLLYIRLSNVPDNRRIGVYELVVAD